MNVRNEIKAQIIRAGMTMQEVVDLLSDEYGWSDSIVGYYTLKKCRSPALRCLQILKKGKIQWQEMMESTAP